ncbi:MAG: hypothetical protein H6710_19390 [Myxococcales bacterium]|nr:hypothetical protein [Myxococcales bacterium]MCB9702300.1 hypothetical protein [Myxococcales bacterium]
MLPVTSVVLFKHGVGYFERHGMIHGEASVELSFRASEMNDVLKSLTVLDHDGGRVASISYESTQPLSKQLEDFAIHIPEGRAISGLLGQLVGTRAVVHRADGASEGVIAGVEPFTRREGEATIEGHRIALWVDGAAFESHDLADVRRVELADQALRKDLQHLLDILISAKKKDLKRLTIFSRGEGERSMTVSYVIETPIWKTSYRVLLYGASTAIQGWALVDNTTDDDWSDVSLTLVAGLPISFVHDLYSPRYKRRPVVVVKEEAAYAPPQLEHGIADLALGGAPGGAPPPPPRMAAPAPAAAPTGRARARAPMRSEDSGPPPPPPQAVTTRTQEVGDLLHYTIDNPVTVRRNQSALVPILHRDFGGKRVAIYNPDVREQNPMSALLFKNTTGLTLEGGPLTVIEDGAYIGEAMLDTIKPDEERVIPFSVELGCRIQVDHRSDLSEVQRARISNGTLYLTRFRLSRRIYLVANKNDRPIDLFLDHRFIPKYELVDTPAPVERTDSFYRFRFDVPARETVRFEVIEKGAERETTAVGACDGETYGIWLRNGYVDAATHARLAEIAAIAVSVTELRRQIHGHEVTIKEIFDNQGRLRENLRALGNAADERRLRERYVAELASEEDRLAELRGAIKALSDEQSAREADVRARIAALSFDSARPG